MTNPTQMPSRTTARMTGPSHQPPGGAPSAPSAPHAPGALPPRPGVGLKPQHYAEILATRPDIGFFEVHAENYMGAGGPPHRYLAAIAEAYPLSLHGVGLSIGADRPLDRDHLNRLAALIRRYRPASFSEHLAWSTHDSGFLNDLLPLPYTDATLARVAAHVDEVQDRLGCRMLLENPTSYLRFVESTWDEVAFLAEVARRTGCGLLLDVNNVHLSAVNLGFDARAYLGRFPMEAVGEIHLAGFAPETDEAGRPLLIDTHDRPVDAKVWALYAYALERAGARPTLIEWDEGVPDWSVLMAEAARAGRLLAARAGADAGKAGGKSGERGTRDAALC
ncbi:MNIO family bufferin maturase [Acidimangrovimonas sediminis]|uniref:MNIO family bufferin maturase n=1 Tax=Acidimangrovimonas sediminis TaxID=2056283 RepID=UPI001E2FC5D7|nr:DUF692 domain-containing protein [Acidimangrovimonas sediminis]